MQQERCALERRQPVKRQHQREGKIVSKLGCRVGREAIGVKHGLRKPGADIDLALRPRALQPIEAEPRDDGDKERLCTMDVVGAGDAKIGILHNILRVTAAAEHAIGKPNQPPAMRRKRIGVRRPV